MVGHALLADNPRPVADPVAIAARVELLAAAVALAAIVVAVAFLEDLVEGLVSFHERDTDIHVGGLGKGGLLGLEAGVDLGGRCEEDAEGGDEAHGELGRRVRNKAALKSKPAGHIDLLRGS